MGPAHQAAALDILLHRCRFLVFPRRFGRLPRIFQLAGHRLAFRFQPALLAFQVGPAALRLGGIPFAEEANAENRAVKVAITIGVNVA